MLIQEHGYLVKQIDAPESTQNGRHKFQRIVLNKPGYTDEFGDKKCMDDIFECRVWNKKINEIPALQKGDKVKAVLSIKGLEYTDKQGKTIYYTQTTIRKIEKI